MTTTHTLAELVGRLAAVDAELDELIYPSTEWLEAYTALLAHYRSTTAPGACRHEHLITNAAGSWCQQCEQFV